ncbi:hypothetical protein, variant [Verruconis gallopava]|uniref:Glucosamine 6-phosphate N-acetyltransferase n=1 Tax=Verruconis gallopava TaxID=253628 RepID=A0A0D1YL87_9PEZI|nr:hypothetical protein, variant [Verruconis gallopava]KIW01567.1 hypothetical protein, variant [Verruconis gallopava]
MMACDSLFPASLISASVQADLPHGYVVRPLQRSDYSRGHLEPLRDLTYIGEISEQQWIERFDWMASCQGTYYVVVIVDTTKESRGSIVATGTLVAEKKFLYKLGIQGHIEDVAVVKYEQGKKLGRCLLAALTDVARNIGCYKVRSEPRCMRFTRINRHVEYT